MKIVNKYKNIKIVKDAEVGTGLILGNNLGNYFYLTDSEESRYQGFFYAGGSNYKDELEVFKIIDGINIIDRGEVEESENNCYEVERKFKSGISEKYFLPDGYNSLCVQTNKKVSAQVVLDMRHPYDSRESGRFYDIKLKDECVLIKYTKYREKNEDTGSVDKKEFTLYLAIKTDKNIFGKIEKFVSKYYEKDFKRNSFPCNRFVYEAINIEFKKAVFSVAKTPKKAIDEANEVFSNFKKLNDKGRDLYGKLKIIKVTDEEIKMACLCSQNSIYSMMVENHNRKGAYAGLPWFFQFWHRDEAISLLQIYNLNEGLAKEIILAQIKFITDDGQIAKKRFYEIDNNELSSVDALGWLANRIIKLDEKHNFSEDLKVEIVLKFEQAIVSLIQKRTSDDGLAISYKNETWMDSLERAGERIEIQACRLNMYRLLYKFTKNDQYEILEKELKLKILEKFYVDGVLRDGSDDGTIRSNIFIMAYLYQELLDNKKWEVCFDRILPKLFLEWGGIASLDVTDKDFISEDTGENSLSYHNGNSWYWINNLTALVLYKTNCHKYSNYINKIMEASTNEILYKGIVGHHSEVSSAGKQTSSGCEAQLWSSAMYLEVFDEIIK